MIHHRCLGPMMAAVDRARLAALARQALGKAGATPGMALATAEALVSAQADGKDAHGLARLESVVASLESGEADGRAEPAAAELGPAMARVDANKGLVFAAYEVAARELATRAAACGVAGVAITNARGVFGPLWVAAERAVEASRNKMAVLVLCNSAAFVTPAPNDTKRVFGTNPIAFAWPRGEGKPPMVLDLATAAASRGEIVKRAKTGKPLEPGWAVAEDGTPTTDPAAALAGAQLPFGGHKGMCLSLVVELMGSCLLGTALGLDANAEDQRKEAGHMKRGILLLGFDIARCAEGGIGPALGDAERLFAAMPRIPGDSRVRARERSNSTGVPVDPDLLKRIAVLAGDEQFAPAVKRVRRTAPTAV